MEMSGDVSADALAAQLAKEKEKNAELLQVQEKLRRELNKARFQAGNLRTELQNAQTVISTSKDAEQIKELAEENQSLKVQLETLKEAIRLTGPGGRGVPASSTVGSKSSIETAAVPDEGGPLKSSSPEPAPGSPAGTAGGASPDAACFSEGVKRAYAEIDRLERLLEERTTELNKWKSKAQEASTAHEKDLAGLWEQLAKKEEEVTALKEKHKKSYNNTESVVQEWSKKCQELQLELNRATSEFETAQTRLVQLEREHFTMTEQLSVMTAMKGSSEATSVMVQDKLEKTLDELEAVKEKLRLATRGKTDAVAELEEARAKAEEFHSELARLQVAVEEKETALDADRRRLAELESLQGQLDEERRSRQEEKDALSTELSFVKEELRSLQDEGRELKRRALDAEDELAKAKAVVTNVTLEAKVANRRNVNIIKDLKSQLKREAAKFDQAQVDITRLENALKLQAEAMLASESSGLADGSSNGTAPGSPSGDGQQQQPVSPTAANNAGGNKRFDWGATLSPLLQGLASHPKAQQVFNFTAASVTTPRTSSSSSAPPSSGLSFELPAVADDEEQASLCSALAKRLETLLGENEKVRERVAFLEKNIRLLQADVERKKILLRHFTGSLRGEDETVTVDSIVKAAQREKMDEDDDGGPRTLELVLRGIYIDNVRLRRDLKMIGEELNEVRKARAPSEGEAFDDDSISGSTGSEVPTESV